MSFLVDEGVAVHEALDDWNGAQAVTHGFRG